MSINEIIIPIQNNDFQITTKMDLTYKSFNELSLNSENLYQSIWNGSLIRSCQFENTNFNRSDFVGVRIEKSYFKNCTFVNIDFKSNIVSKSKFINCIFDDASFLNLEITNCQFVNCEFQGAIFLESKIKDTLLESLKNQGADFSLNEFVNVTFKDIKFGDCSFYYNILNKCNFNRCAINVDSLGKVIGLNKKNIKNFDLIFLGSEINSENIEDLHSEIKKEFELRRWYFQLSVFELNSEMTSNANGIEKSFASIINLYKNKVIIQKDEIVFFKMILSYFDEVENLPILSLLKIIRNLENTLISNLHREENEYSFNLLNNFNVFLVSIVHKKLQFYSEDSMLQYLEQNDFPIILRIRYLDKTLISTVNLLNKIQETSGEKICQKTKLLEVKKGSVVELLATSIKMVALLRIFLYLINGCIIDIKEIKLGVTEITKKEPQNSYLQTVLTGEGTISKPLLSSLDTMTKVAEMTEITNHIDLKGFSEKNITNMEITTENYNKK